MDLKLYNELQFLIIGQAGIVKETEKRKGKRDYKGRNRITSLIVKKRDCLR